VKICLITDTHFGFKKGNKIFHDYFKKFYEDVFFPFLIKNKIDTVVHLGDSFDNRKGIDYWSLEWAKDVVYDTFQTLGITVYNIVGNHDIYYKNSTNLNSVDHLLSEYDNVIKIAEPKEFNIAGLDILMLPWITTENQQNALRMVQNSSSGICMGHLELNGFRVNSKIVMDHGMEPNIFDKFYKTFSGHYHTRSTNGKVFYMGNPYQLFWTDINDTRGFVVFDTETLEHDYVNNPYDMFRVINYDEDNLQEDLSEYENSIVKVVVKNKSDQKLYEKYIDKLIKANPHEFKVIESYVIVDPVSDDGDTIESEDTLSLLKKYVDESEINLNKGKIKNLINSIYQESYSIQ
jgi:DNA repair exonuclease SbcCD nuclease subunit